MMVSALRVKGNLVSQRKQKLRTTAITLYIYSDFFKWKDKEKLKLANSQTKIFNKGDLQQSISNSTVSKQWVYF